MRCAVATILKLGAMFSAIGAFAISDAGQRLIQNGITLAALLVAIKGVRNWNQERRDLRRAELAEKTLATTYRAKDAIAFVRSPFGFGGEGQSRKHGANESEEKSAALDSAFAPIERANKAAAIFEEIQSLRYSISAAFSPAAAQPLSVFMEIRAEIIAASQSRMRDITQPGPINDAAIARSERNDAVIWEGYGEADTIVSRVDGAIAALEAQFRPYVEATFKPPNRFFKWRNKTT
jgi:hypothetical protein